MTLSKQQLAHFQEKLEVEKKQLENELSHVGKKNPEVEGDWQVTQGEINLDVPDQSDLANTFEELENRAALENTLEERLIMVNKALERIEKGEYGYCDNCKKQIDVKRLEANPAASECIDHA